MIHIKKFIDKVTHMEGRGGRDVVLPIADARGLRDELSKLLVDNNKLLTLPAPINSGFQMEYLKMNTSC